MNTKTKEHCLTYLNTSRSYVFLARYTRSLCYFKAAREQLNKAKALLTDKTKTHQNILIFNRVA